jgi:hypothetical protein
MVKAQRFPSLFLVLVNPGSGFPLIVFLIGCCLMAFTPFRALAIPVVDGVIGAGEYPSGADPDHGLWYADWTVSHFYVAKVGGGATEPIIMYMDVNPMLPVNINNPTFAGNLVGTTDFGVTGRLPFAGDLRIFWQVGYADVYIANGSGGWTLVATNSLPGLFTINIANGINGMGQIVRELRINWGVFGVVPQTFNTFAYQMNPSNGFKFHQIPAGNPTGLTGNPAPPLTHYFSIPVGGTPATIFANKSFTYHADNSAAGSGGFLFDATANPLLGTSFYDFTINDNSLNNNDNSTANDLYDNNEIANRVRLNSNISISHNLYIGAGSALLPENNWGGAGDPRVVDINMTGAAGSLYNYGRLDCNPEAGNAGDWELRRITFTINGSITLQPNAGLNKDRYRFSNITIPSGGSLLAPPADSVEIELQWGVVENEGSIQFGNGITGGTVNTSIRGDWGQQNVVAMTGGGNFTFYHLLIGRRTDGAKNSFPNTLRPQAGALPVTLNVNGNFSNFAEFQGTNTGGAELNIRMSGQKRQFIQGTFEETVEQDPSTITAALPSYIPNCGSGFCKPRTIFHGLEIANDNGSGDNTGSDVYFNTFGAGNVDYYVTGELRFTAGDLVTRNGGSCGSGGDFHKLTLLDGATIAFQDSTRDDGAGNPDPSSYVDGPLGIVVNTNGTPATYPFPIGRNGAYRLLRLTIDNGDPTPLIYEGELNECLPPLWSLLTSGGPPANEPVLGLPQPRYWELRRNPDGVSAPAMVSTAGLELHYNPDDYGPTLSPGDLRVVKDDGAGGWLNFGGTGNTTGPGKIKSFYNITSFSDITLGSVGPFPVELLEFTGKLAGNSVQLQWTTANEVNADGFFILRSTDGIYFNEIGWMKATGESEKSQRYAFSDDALPSGQAIYYRLRQMDLDGSFFLSDIVEISRMDLSHSPVLIYPNPASDKVTLFFPETPGSAIVIEMTDMRGKIVRDFQFLAEQELELDLNGLAAGMYLLRVETEAFMEVRKIWMK